MTTTSAADTSDYQIIAVSAQHTAVVQAEVAFSELPQIQRSARQQIAAALPALDVAPIGLHCTLSRMSTPGRIYLEPGVIVAHDFSAVGDVVASHLPGGQAVQYVLRGSFHQLPEAWPKLMQWCAAQELPLEGTFWEIYGPEPVAGEVQITTLYALLKT